jgi:hypothetical protein
VHEPSEDVDAPDPKTSYVVFAQREDALLDVAALNAHATRFFDAKVALTNGSVVLSTSALSGTRRVFTRRKIDSDLTLEETGSGLVLLARRCAMVWLVIPENEDDPVALAIATILASHLLGPILARGELMGVKTARLKWSRAAS